ncbi:hypothetical protein [Ulvibacterium sp.]|uniref:hypothetical protein n=1 Tax=Ulvibacterium sp. TaxID=2665914 RepID=UPI0026302385|nr:hypothetical protein [Ulvibacterium sp.]
MKRLFIYMIGAALLSVGFISCEEDEKDPMQVHLDEANKAPYVRILYDNVVAVDQVPSASFDANLDAFEDNVQSWSVDVSLEGSADIDATPLTTVSTFPSDISIPFTEIATTLGITAEDIAAGDILRFLGTATSSSGFVANQDNFSGSILGQPEQNQAFNFIVQIECAPITDVSVGGTWTVDAFDSFGDGWNGASINFVIDGVNNSFTFGSGGSANFSIDVPDGSTLLIFFSGGSFDEEVTFTVNSPSGPYAGGQTFGPNPGRCIN